MSAIEERFARMKTTMLEFMDGFNEVKGRIHEVEEMLLLELTTIANIFMAPLHLKNESLKAIIEALKMEVLDLKVHNSYKAEFKALKLEVQELKTELLLCKTSITSCVVPIQAAQDGCTEAQGVQGQPIC